MNRRELLDRLAADAEQRMLLSRCLDKLTEAQMRRVPAATGFLSPAEQAAVRPLLAAAGNPDCLFPGGYPGAERRRCLFLPDWLAEAQAEESDYVRALRCSWYRGEELTHRDLLGALMGLGVKRETVGDLLVSAHSCDLLVLPPVVPFLVENFTSAGRSRLKTEEIPLSALCIPQPEVKIIQDTVSTLRLDSVLAAAFSLSRARAGELIRTGKAAVNWQETQKPDRPVAEGDVISCRGLGKCRLKQVGGLSRKGRIQIIAERYL